MFKRLSLLWTVLRGDARLLWHALRVPGSPLWLELGVLAVVVYVLWPIDLIPEVLPVIGIVDDLVLIPLAVRLLVSRLPPWLHAEARRRAGMA